MKYIKSLIKFADDLKQDHYIKMEQQIFQENIVAITVQVKDICLFYRSDFLPKMTAKSPVLTVVTFGD